MGGGGLTSGTVDIATLLKSSSSNEPSVSPTRQLRPASVPPLTASSPLHRQPTYGIAPAIPALMPGSRRSMTPHVPEQPVKKQSKWSPEEDALIIELRGSGMKWEDVSKRLPGRSAISCRLHYQNYLERRSEWDEERKNKLARLYERFKSDMWAKVAEELAVPWRAAEAMHWQLGEADMARRAGVVPFSLAAINVEAGNRNLPARGQSQPQDSGVRELRPPSPRSSYGRNPPMAPISAGRGLRRGAPNPPPPPPPKQQPMMHHSPQLQHGPSTLSAVVAPGPPPPPSTSHNDYHQSPGPGLAPIQTHLQSRNPGLLPSVAQLTTGMSPYGPQSGPPTPTSLPSINLGAAAPFSHYSSVEPTGSKRRASPDMTQRDSGHRRRMG